MSYLEKTLAICENGGLTHDHAAELASRLDAAEKEYEIMKEQRDRSRSRVVELFNASINEQVKAAHQNAINKGWYEEPRSFGEVIALMHSELSEALEDHRHGFGFTEIYFEEDKPCGIPTEFADTVIRIFDTCGHLGIDLGAAIAQKMAYNATRSIRHGGKKL